MNSFLPKLHLQPACAQPRGQPLSFTLRIARRQPCAVSLTRLLQTAEHTCKLRKHSGRGSAPCCTSSAAQRPSDDQQHSASPESRRTRSSGCSLQAGLLAVSYICASSQAASSEELTNDQAGPKTFGQWVLTVASISTFVALAVVTLGVLYLAFNSFMDKRTEDKDQKEIKLPSKARSGGKGAGASVAAMPRRQDSKAVTRQKKIESAKRKNERRRMADAVASQPGDNGADSPVELDIPIVGRPD